MDTQHVRVTHLRLRMIYLVNHWDGFIVRTLVGIRAYHSSSLFKHGLYIYILVFIPFIRVSHFSHILLKWPIHRDVIRYATKYRTVPALSQET